MWDGEKWVDAEGTTLNFKAADNREEILWEPGCTYDLPKLRIVNKGNLALKYTVEITGINGDAKLNEAIDWTVGIVVNRFDGIRTEWSELGGYNSNLYLKDQTMNPVEKDTITAGVTQNRPVEFTIRGHMKETAGNEYQGLSIEGISITVVATQAPVENDSNGRTYDEDAVYPSFNVDSTSSNDHKAGTTIKESVTLANSVIKHTFNNTINDCSGIVIKGEATNVTFNNVDFDVKQNASVGRNLAIYVYGSTLTINSGDYKIDGANTYFLWIQNAIDSTFNSKVTINGGTFISNSQGALLTAYSAGSVLEINGGFFDQSAGNANLTIQGGVAYGKGTVIVKGGTFVNFNPLEHVAEGYKVVSETQSNGQVYHTVVKAD